MHIVETGRNTTVYLSVRTRLSVYGWLSWPISRDSQTHSWCSLYIQEVLLPQTDRATSKSCQLLHLWTSYTTNQQQIQLSNVVRVIEIEHYRWWTCNKLRASSRDASTVWVLTQQPRPSTSFVDNRIDFPWRNFPSPQFPIRKYIYFWRYSHFYNTM